MSSLPAYLAWLLVALTVGADGFSMASPRRTNIQRRPHGISPRTRCILAAQDNVDGDDEFAETDADSASSGPKILMPPEELLDVVPSEADNFGSYLLPYAGLVLLALALASAAFATLVLSG